MPPVRIRERKRVKKGTLKRLLKYLFQKHAFALIVSFLCIAFNVFANLSSSIFTNFITTAISESVHQGLNPFKDLYSVTAMGVTLETNITYLLIALGSIYLLGICGG